MALCSNRFSPCLTRRQALQRAGSGFGMLALAGLMERNGLLAAPLDPSRPMAPQPPSVAPKATSVIWLFQEGGPSGFDLFDHGDRIIFLGPSRLVVLPDAELDLTERPSP